MTKKNKKIILITSMITILPILAGLILWNKLPEQVATHFDANGIPNGYSSRAFAVFGPYLICLFAHLFCAFGTLADPKKQAIGQKMYALILWICPDSCGRDLSQETMRSLIPTIKRKLDNIYKKIHIEYL